MDCFECYEAQYYWAQQLYVAGVDDRKKEEAAISIIRELARLRLVQPPLRGNALTAKAEVIYYLATDPVGCTLSTDMLPRVLQFQVRYERAVGPDGFNYN